MNILKTFLAGAFLGAGVIGAWTHAAWTSSLRASTIIPALTVADLMETVGAVVAGLVALVVVRRQERRRLAQTS